MLSHFSPCVYERNRRVCAIPKGFHSTGHFDSTTGDFESPVFPKNLHNTLFDYLTECFKQVRVVIVILDPSFVFSLLRPSNLTH